MSIDLSRLTPAPWGTWRYKATTICTQETEDETSCVHLGEMESVADADFVALARNDLDVKQRRGWHTEKCTESGQWYVPQLSEYVIRKVLMGGLKGKGDSGFDACYQNEHDIGLLTKADRWYREHVEGKPSTQQQQ